MIFRSRFLEMTVGLYKNVHIFLSKFYKKTIISRGPLSEPHAPLGSADHSLGNTVLRNNHHYLNFVRLDIWRITESIF